MTFLPLRLLALLPSLGLSRSALDSSLLLSILTLFPLRLHAAPNLNPIFHITSRKSYSAAEQEAVRRTASARRNGETFLSSLCFYPLLSLSLSPFFLLPRAARSKTISEHIAPRFSRSALRTRSTAMSSCLFDPRGRRNNACTTTVVVFPQFPLFSSFVLAPLLHAFRRARNLLGGKKRRRESWRIRASRKINSRLIH